MKDSDSESPPQAARAAQAAPAVPAVPAVPVVPVATTTEAAPAVVALRQRAEAKQWVCAKKRSFLRVVMVPELDFHHM